MSIAEDGHRARLADYADRAPAGFEDLSDDELLSKLQMHGFTASTAARLVEVRDDPATAEYLDRHLERAS